MLRGIGASRKGMAWEQTQVDVIANNVANVNTDGFKRSEAVGQEFAPMLLERLGDPNSTQPPTIGVLGNGAELAQVATDGSQGVWRNTGNPLDVGIAGPGEFTFLGPSGVGYTRNGSFHQDATGRLVTAEGDPVLLVGGTSVGGVGQKLSIRPDGVVEVDGQAAGRLDIRGNNAPSLVIGTVEGSNVDMGQEITDLMIAQRAYQINQRAFQIQDQTLNQAANDLGKV